MKILRIAAAVAGLATLLFAGLAFQEFQTALRQPAVPQPEDFKLTHLVGSELWEGSVDKNGRPEKPSQIITRISRRIWAIGTLGGLVFVGGSALAFMKRSNRADE